MRHNEDPGQFSFSFFAALVVAGSDYSSVSLLAYYSAAACLLSVGSLSHQNKKLGACTVKAVGMLAGHFVMYL